jgi:hypothetical protein
MAIILEVNRGACFIIPAFVARLIVSNRSFRDQFWDEQSDAPFLKEMV